jgi:MFS family permease
MTEQTSSAAPPITAVAADLASPVLDVSTFGKWMALLAALLGWLFDGLEMGLFPLVQRPALQELLAHPEERDTWIGIITAFFLVGAATGGVLFGWLGDRMGRVRAMMLSVLTYALCSGLCGFAATPWHVGLLRFVAALGMGGEWALGVALINEIWPGRSRAFLAGLVGAAGNVGYLLIAVVGLGVLQQVQAMRSVFNATGLPEAWVDALFRNQGWRFMMMVGAIPALLTFFIRFFVPESTRWKREQQKGSTQNWLTKDLVGVLLGAVGACALIAVWAPGPGIYAVPNWVLEQIGQPPVFEQPMHLGLRITSSVLCLLVILSGYTYPVVRFLQRLHAKDPTQPSWRPTLRRMLVAACLSGVALVGTWGSTQQAPTYAADVADTDWRAIPPDERPPMPPAKEYTQIAAAFGAVLATVLAALMGDWFGRRPTYCLMCLGSLVIVPTFYLATPHFGPTFLVLAFLLGGITASFYGWLPLYLPELFRTSVRATGSGFGFNFGRVLAAIGVLQLGNLTGLYRDAGVGGLAEVCATLSVVYVAGLFFIWLVPETRGKPLPE